jgi:hypothetical protein
MTSHIANVFFPLVHNSWRYALQTPVPHHWHINVKSVTLFHQPTTHELHIVHALFPPTHIFMSKVWLFPSIYSSWHHKSLTPFFHQFASHDVTHC